MAKIKHFRNLSADRYFGTLPIISSSKHNFRLERFCNRLTDQSVVCSSRRKCWGKISRTRLTGIKRGFNSYEEYSQFVEELGGDDMVTNRRCPRDEGESSDDEDETQTERWNWYIS